MTAKDYLSQISLLDVKIDQRIKERQGLIELADRCSKTTELEKDVLEIITRFELEKHTIINKIHGLNKQRHITLLYKRYVQSKNIQQIAEEMNYSYEHTVTLHSNALKEFSKLYADILK